MSERFVQRQDQAVLGVPESCPTCGGQLSPAFGQRVDDDGRRYAVLDPTYATCRDCGGLFRTTAHPDAPWPANF